MRRFALLGALLMAGCHHRQLATRAIRPAGSNVANAAGSIEPIGTARSTFSVMFLGAVFSASFDILPHARPFSMVATTDAGGATIDIDPGHGTYRSSFTVPTAAERAGDFSRTGLTILDFLTCSVSGCLPVPGRVIPLSRQDPLQTKAMAQIPLPNIAGTPDAINGLWLETGSLPASGHFAVSNATFGGFFPTAALGGPERMATYTLTIDGISVASRQTAYTVP